MNAEVAEVAGILATLSRAGVAVRVSRGRLVVRGAALNFTEAIATLEGREDAVEKALAFNDPRARGKGTAEARPLRDRVTQGIVARHFREEKGDLRG